MVEGLVLKVIKIVEGLMVEVIKMVEEKVV